MRISPDRLKAFYNSRTKREKIMLYAFLIAALGLWYTQLAKSSSELADAITDTGAKLSAAEMVISQESAISENLLAAQRAFDESKTISPRTLQDLVEECARKTSLQYQTNLPASSENAQSGRIAISTLRFTAQHAALENIIEFEKNLRTLEPYAVVKEAVLSADGKGRVNARYKICSFNFPQK